MPAEDGVNKLVGSAYHLLNLQSFYNQPKTQGMDNHRNDCPQAAVVIPAIWKEVYPG
jgi:hypothetical protein